MPDRAHDRVIGSFEVHINGTRLPPEAEADLFLLDVWESIEEISMFSLHLNAGDPRTGGIKWVDGDLFREGAEVKIKAGFHAPLSELIAGEIAAIEPDFPEAGPVTLTVRGYDRLYKLAFGRRTRSYRNVKDSDIAAQLAHEWGLTPDVETTSVTHAYLLQSNQTDLEFLAERARQVRYEVKVDGKTLRFRRPREAAGKAVTLAYGEELLSFSPRLSVAAQVSEAKVQAWNAKDKAAMQGRAASGDEVSTMGGKATGAALAEELAGDAPLVVVAEPVGSPEEAEQLALGEFNAAAFDLVQADGSCIGEPLVRAGVVVELRELGQRFSGLYYVVSATHSLSARRGFITNFSVRRSAA